MTGQVKYLDWITRDMLRDDPDAIFVFGDNMRRVGMGGQAREMRGEPNALGVATLYAPGDFYRDGDLAALRCVASDLKNIAAELEKGKTVYVPRDGLGSGLGRLRESYPALHNLIVAFFRDCPGEPCLWEFA